METGNDKVTKQEMDESGRSIAVATNTSREDRQTAESHQGEQLLNAEGQSQPFESHFGNKIELPQGKDRKETCTCSWDPALNTEQRATNQQTLCHLCGKLTKQSSGTHSPPSENGQAFADGLHFTPSTAEAFHEGNDQSTRPSTSTAAQNDPAAVEGGWEKHPVEGIMSPTTVQVPSRPRRWTFFSLVENHPEINEKWFSIYFFPSQRYEDETHQTMEDLQRSRFDFTNVVSSAREDEITGLERAQHFHDVFMEGHARLTITFQLLERRPGSFRMRGQIADRIPTAAVLSLSQSRLPSPTARVFVEHLGAPGELHQGDIIMTIDHGERLTHIIPIWDSPDVTTSSLLPTVACSIRKAVRMYKCQKIKDHSYKTVKVKSQVCHLNCLSTNTVLCSYQFLVLET